MTGSEVFSPKGKLIMKELEPNTEQVSKGQSIFEMIDLYVGYYLLSLVELLNVE